MGQEFCNAKSRRTGKPCRHPAGWGTDHVGKGQCRVHGGSTRTGSKHGAKLLAEQEAARLPLLADVGPDEALSILQRRLFWAWARLVSSVDSLEGKDGLPLSAGARAEHPGARAERELALEAARIAKLVIDAGVEVLGELEQGGGDKDD